MGSLQALLFDVDGTLADTEEVHRQAFNEAFAAEGLDWHWSVPLYNELLAVTGGRERIRSYIEGYLPGFQAPDDLDAWIAALHRDKTTRYTRAVAEGRIPMRPGIRRLLEQARAEGLRLAIATTTSPANVTALLEHSLRARSTEWFDVIAAGDVVPAKKPAPDIYTYALNALGIPPEHCLSFEDSGNGVAASLGAGVDTIVTVNEFTRTHDFDGALVVLDHLGEPDLRPRVLAGDIGAAAYVDVPLLRRLHAARAERRAG